MKTFFNLLSFQLKDKIDLGWLKNKKTAGRRIILNLVRFVLVTGVIFAFIYLTEYLGIYYRSDLNKVFNLLLTMSLIMLTISCTFGLMKTLYFAEDNRVLITLPVSSNQIFISKIIVYFIYEIKRSFSLLVPIILGNIIYLFSKSMIGVWGLFWMWIPTLLLVALPVLVGTILSIPMMFIYKFLKDHPLISVFLAFGLLAGVIVGIIYVINLIPTNISLVEEWPTYAKYIKNFFNLIETKLVITGYGVQMIIGTAVNSVFHLTLNSFLFLGILVGFEFVLFFLAFFISRPLFFTMMAKNFESDKKDPKEKTNHIFGKYITFAHKELLINFRTISISLNYVLVYIAVPILVLLFNKIVGAMETKSNGDVYKYVFNLLIIILPLLASNALVATYFSREGRAAYIKRTKPINVVPALASKLILNFVLSIPCVIASVLIFTNSMKCSIAVTICLVLIVACLHFSHMIMSAKMDIANPQNEEYATNGDEIDNPNENKSTILAFVISIVFCIFSYKLISEGLDAGNILPSVVKLSLISISILVLSIMMFFKYIKAFYFE